MPAVAKFGGHSASAKEVEVLILAEAGRVLASGQLPPETSTA